MTFTSPLNDSVQPRPSVLARSCLAPSDELVYLPVKNTTEAFSLLCQQQSMAKEISRNGWSTPPCGPCSHTAQLPLFPSQEGMCRKNGGGHPGWMTVLHGIRLCLLSPSDSALHEHEATGGIISGPIRSICSYLNPSISAGPLLNFSDNSRSKDVFSLLQPVEFPENQKLLKTRELTKI